MDYPFRALAQGVRTPSSSALSREYSGNFVYEANYLPSEAVAINLAQGTKRRQKWALAATPDYDIICNGQVFLERF